jgi:hypothetical protein
LNPGKAQGITIVRIPGVHRRTTGGIEMDIEFKPGELKELVLSSYDLMLSIEDLDKNYMVQSRSKLKNLPESLREFEDARSSVVHFVKSAAYFLPRSDAKLNKYLTQLLISVNKIQNSQHDPEKVREMIRYLIGYSNWSMDSVCTIFKKAGDDTEVRKRLKTMVAAEMDIVGGSEHVDNIVNNIMKWKAGADGRRY